MRIRNAISADYFPNLTAVCREACPTDPTTQQQLITGGKKCVEPGIDYFNEKFGSDGVHPVATFRVLQIFHPQTAYEMGPTAASVDELRVVPFLSDQIENLKQELPSYLAKASAIGSSTSQLCPSDILDWWKRHAQDLPHWSQASQFVFLIQPSSAASERIFLILTRLSDTHCNALEDYVECTTMQQYNKRKN